MRILKLPAVVLLFVMMSSVVIAADETPSIHVNHAALKKLAWQFGAGSSTFHDITAFEMIDKLHGLDAHHIELSPGQSLSPEHKDVKVGPALSDADIEALMAKLKAVKMDIVSYGPIALKDEADARKAFELAKKLKAKNVVILESAAVPMEALDKLADENAVRATFFLRRAGESGSATRGLQTALNGRSPRVTVCAEIDGSSSATATAETVKALGSRVVEVRMTNVGPDQAPVFQQLKDQGFKGICSIGYESGDASERQRRFVESVNAFSDLIGKVAGVAPEGAK